MQPSPASDTVVEARGLTKRYRGGQLAVDGLDLEVPRGSVFGSAAWARFTGRDITV
ncbi:hypothetical protein GCM10023079_53310 [Streptomyces chitinivorans]